MYVSVSSQKAQGKTFGSVGNFVGYLEKENEFLKETEKELFFNHKGNFSAEHVVKDIDSNIAKLKKTEAKFYTITINPSKRELQLASENKLDLKAYTNKVMEEYAKNFNRQIDGRPLRLEDIKYYAKIENIRRYKGHDKEVRANSDINKKLAKLEHDLVKIKRGTLSLDAVKLKEEIAQLKKSAPYKIAGEPIRQGMKKEGDQRHIHIIVSRKDESNRISLSPNSRYAKSDVKFNGKDVKRGFNKDAFFGKSEKSFDDMVGYNRNFVLSYEGRNLRKKNPSLFYSKVNLLPEHERKEAYRIIKERDAITDNQKAVRTAAKTVVNTLKTEMQKVVLPNEVRDAITILENGKVPGSKISVSKLKGHMRTAETIGKLFGTGTTAVPEPTTQAARLVIKFAKKALKISNEIGRASSLGH